ncbi:MAG: hypothetical protein M3362_06825 [Acidobacteriota bacterium]|nr:hypothetical protein [Acidobacteriota bacterium]
MKKQLLAIVSVVLAGIGLGINSGALAQTPCAQGRVLSAQERIAQRDIRERINESIEADIARDAEAGARNLTDDFTVKLLDGTVLNRQQFLEGNKEQKDSLLLVSDRTRITIDCLILKGKEATVYTNQHYVRYMPDRKDGSPHEVITNITHRETWVFTSEGWKVRHIEELQRGATLLNGQPYNP